MSKQGLSISSETSLDKLLPERKLTRKFVETAYKREADFESATETILGDTGTVVRLPSLEGIIWECPMDWITPNPEQPRSYFDPEKMDELKQTIGSVGQKEPVKVVPYTDGESVRFFIVDGERRYRTLQNLGYSHAKILVGGETTMEEIFDTSLILNISRAQHNPVEIARAFQRRIDYFTANPTDNRRPTQLVAEKYGFSEGNVYNHLRLLKLPKEIQDLIIKGKLPMSNALTLLKSKIKKAGDTEASKQLELQQTARHLLDQIHAEKFSDADQDSGKKAKDKNTRNHRKGPSKTGKITMGMIKAAKETTLLTQGNAVDAGRLATAEQILKVIGHVTAMEPQTRELLSRQPAMVVAGLRSMGLNRPPEVINDRILEVRVLLEQLQELCTQATLPPPLFVPKNKPGFLEHLGKRKRSFASPVRHKIARALAEASDREGGHVLTWSDLAEQTGQPANEITGNLAPIREELAALGLDLQQFEVRRRDNRGNYEKYPAYRLSWTDARSKNPLTVETFNFKEIATKTTLLSPDRIALDCPENKPYPALTFALQEHLTERINALGREVEFHPVRSNQVIFELHPRARRPEILEFGSNIRNFTLNYSIFETDLLSIVRQHLPKTRAIVLKDIIRKQDQVSSQKD